MNKPPQSISISPVTQGWKLTILAQTYQDAERFAELAGKELREELERQKPRKWRVLVSCDGQRIESPVDCCDERSQWYSKPIIVQEVK